MKLKKFIILIMMLTFSFGLLNVKGILTVFNYDLVFRENITFNLNTGRQENSNMYMSTERLNIVDNLYVDNINEYFDVQAHHILFWNQNNSYIGYYNFSGTTLQMNKYLDDVAGAEINIPTGSRKFSIVASKIDASKVIPYQYNNSMSINQLNGLSLNNVFSNNLFETEQLVTNGDFENGTTGWSVGRSTISTSNGSLVVVPTGVHESPFIYQAIDVPIENDYYFVTKLKPVDYTVFRSVSFASGGNLFPQINIEPNNQFNIYSGVYNLPSKSNNNFYLYLNHFNTTNMTNVEIDYYYVFNTTTLKTNKQHSPMYNTTFDLMSDADIKTQMDYFTQNPWSFIDYTGIENVSQETLFYWYGIYLRNLTHMQIMNPELEEQINYELMYNAYQDTEFYYRPMIQEIFNYYQVIENYDFSATPITTHWDILLSGIEVYNNRIYFNDTGGGFIFQPDASLPGNFMAMVDVEDVSTVASLGINWNGQSKPFTRKQFTAEEDYVYISIGDNYGYINQLGVEASATLGGTFYIESIKFYDLENIFKNFPNILEEEVLYLYDYAFNNGDYWQIPGLAKGVVMSHIDIVADMLFGNIGGFGYSNFTILEEPDRTEFIDSYKAVNLEYVNLVNLFSEDYEWVANNIDRWLEDYNFLSSYQKIDGNDFQTTYAYYIRDVQPTPPSDLGNAIDDALDSVGLNTTFFKTIIMLLISIIFSILLAVLSAPGSIILITNVILLIFWTIVGWVAPWFILVLFLLLVFLVIYNKINSSGGEVL